MRLLGFMCLTIFLMSLGVLYCATDSFQMTFGLQFLLFIVEGILFFIPPAILVQWKDKNAEYAEWFVRLISLIIGNALLANQFVPKEGFDYATPVFTINGTLFFLLSFLMFSKETENH